MKRLLLWLRTTFVSGLLAGWRHALDPANAQKAIRTVQNYDRDSTLGVLKAQLEATRRLVLPSDGDRLGAIDAQAWQQTETIMRNAGQIPEAVHVTTALLPVDGF